MNEKEDRTNNKKPLPDICIIQENATCTKEKFN